MICLCMHGGDILTMHVYNNLHARMQLIALPTWYLTLVTAPFVLQSMESAYWTPFGALKAIISLRALRSVGACGR